MRKIRYIAINMIFALIVTLAFSGCTPAEKTGVAERHLTAVTQGTEEGYYAGENPNGLNGGFNIMYTDYNTKTKLVLCSASSCEHKDETCTGYVKGTPLSIFVVKDKIVIFSYAEENGEYVKNILTADLNGENHNIIYKIHQSESDGGEYYCDGESIYFTLSKPMNTDDGLIYRQFLVKLNIYTGEMQELLNLYEKYDGASVNISGACNDELILNIFSSESFMESVKLDGTRGRFPREALVFEDFSIAFDGEYAYYIFYNDNSIKRKNMTTGEEQAVTGPEDVKLIFGACDIKNVYDGKLLFSVTKHVAADRNDTLYAVDFDNSEFVEINLKFNYNGMAKPVDVVAQTDKYFLVINNIKDVKHYYPDNPKGITEDLVPTPQYALIEKNDFWSSNPNYIDITYNP